MIGFNVHLTCNCCFSYTTNYCGSAFIFDYHFVQSLQHGRDLSSLHTAIKKTFFLLFRTVMDSSGIVGTIWHSFGLFRTLYDPGVRAPCTCRTLCHVIWAGFLCKRDFSTFAKGFLLHKLLLKVNYSPLRVKKSRSHDMGHWLSRLY
jgi:hypothetical protein